MSYLQYTPLHPNCKSQSSVHWPADPPTDDSAQSLQVPRPFCEILSKNNTSPTTTQTPFFLFHWFFSLFAAFDLTLNILHTSLNNLVHYHLLQYETQEGRNFVGLFCQNTKLQRITGLIGFWLWWIRAGLILRNSMGDFPLPRAVQDNEFGKVATRTQTAGKLMD